ncbi:MAG: hypothetical protein Q8J85_14085 [Sulfuricurvum sp.]|nr:hypothetical protein [Sulfuricurvum sp.]
MPDFPLHPTLFISLAILSGFVIAPILAYTDKKSPIENSTSNANFLLSTTWYLAAGFGIALVSIYFSSPAKEAEEMAKALTPIGMMIAALIASASVMKNIAETKANETKKHEKEDSKFYLEQCIKTLEHIYDLLGKQRNDIFAWREAASMLITMKNLSKHITQEPHIRIFKVEYNKYSAKILNTFLQIYPEDGCMTIKPSFFCCDSNWQNLDLVDCFQKNNLLINPQFIIPIFQFAQTPNNSFLESLEDENYYGNWRDIDLNEFKENNILWKFVSEYIELYKKRITV